MEADLWAIESKVCTIYYERIIMPGFLITNFAKNASEEVKTDGFIFRKKENEYFSVFQNTISKFIDDKIFYDDNEYFILTEGVLLNNKELAEQYKAYDLASLILKMNKENKLFFKNFRGSFSGCFFDKKLQSLIAWTNQYGDNVLFYWNNGKKFIVSSDKLWLINCLSANNIKYDLDEKAVYYMLTYAYMPDDSTFIQGVKRLLPGNYIEISYKCNNSINCNINSYYEIKRDKCDLQNASEEEIIEETDRLFRKAVIREYEKDKEYGYKHLCELSGGLDSRMSYWVAHTEGYQDILAITYAQSGSPDESIAEQIAEAWHEDILVWPLDSANHLCDLEEYNKMNQGASLYSGIGGQIRIFEKIKLEEYGLLHSGEIGDVVISSFLSDEAQLYQKGTMTGAYSEKLIDKLNDDSFEKYENTEERMMVVRACLGCMSSHLMTQYYTEIASPFCDVDLIDYCMSIPLEKRVRHRIYKKWILSKYPEAGSFRWESTGTTLYTGKIAQKVYNVQKKVRKKIYKLINGEGQWKDNMNPMDHWYKENSKLRDYMGSYYEENKKIKILEEHENLRRDMDELFKSGTACEKTQVLTALNTIKILFK